MWTGSEKARLQSLRQLNLLDTPPSEGFDRVTRTASLMFRLPYAAISLTDSDRNWFKSRIGLNAVWMERRETPCSIVTETRQALVIPDLAVDAGFMGGKLRQSGFRFYAGAPLVTREGHCLGALCVLGREPRAVAEDEMTALHDLAAMVMAQIELQHAFGRIDVVTGLPNRSRFEEDLLDLARDFPGKVRIAVLVDLADTTQLNNLSRVMGYEHVQEMVQYSAGGLRHILGEGRIGYHVAPTQFAFLAPVDVDLDAYMGIVAAGLAEGQSASTFRFVATAVVGIVPFTLGTREPGDLLRSLHSAAQDARATGKSVSVYSPSVDSDHRRRFRLLQDFGAALLAPDQLRLVFQPRIELSGQSCIGAEALLRWSHPELGNISPGEFIPIVEHSTHARAMTAWVIDRAARQLKEWQRAGIDLKLSLNISAANLEEKPFAEEVSRLLSLHDVAPDDIELEMTESAIMKDTGLALQQLHALAKLGVKLAIDDFGTGYSSLAYLQRLPMHVVKIDQAFVRNVVFGPRERKLVGSMIALSQDLGLRVVAEGVESRETAGILREMGCEEAQGYFFAPGLEAKDFLAWLSTHKPLGTVAASKRSKPAAAIHETSPVSHMCE